MAVPVLQMVNIHSGRGDFGYREVAKSAKGARSHILTSRSSCLRGERFFGCGRSAALSFTRIGHGSRALTRHGKWHTLSRVGMIGRSLVRITFDDVVIVGDKRSGSEV